MQIVVEDVSFSYQMQEINPLWALEDISFQVDKGQFVSIIGHSGSGKSTLTMLLAGLQLPGRGRVLLNNQEAKPKSVFPHLGFVFQYPEQQLFGETVLEEISFGPRNFGAAEAKLPQIAAEALKAVGLQPDKFLLRSPFSLSGGEKRRVAIASVLAVGAEVLIFDEPTAGLDERGRRWILDLARRENESGKTIIWISHNMDEVAEVAGRLLVLDRGHLVADGSTDEVFAQEDKLAALGLDIPQPARLVRRLKDGGFPIPAQALVEDEAYQEISKALGGKNHDKR